MQLSPPKGRIPQREKDKHEKFFLKKPEFESRTQETPIFQGFFLIFLFLIFFRERIGTFSRLRVANCGVFSNYLQMR